MRSDRISAWTLALLVAAAAVTKLADLEATGRDVGALLETAGFGRTPEPARVPLAASIAVAEIAIAIVVAWPRRSRVGLVALSLLVSAGVLVVGAATSWGGDSDLACPCGLPLELPFLRNTFAALLVRDALLLALVALAWGPRVTDMVRCGNEARAGRGAAV